jgi:hypothetical protein
MPCGKGGEGAAEIWKQFGKHTRGSKAETVHDATHVQTVNTYRCEV